MEDAIDRLRRVLDEIATSARAMYAEQVVPQDVRRAHAILNELAGSDPRTLELRRLARAILDAPWSAEAGVFAEAGSGADGRAALAQLQDDIGQLHRVLDELDMAFPPPPPDSERELVRALGDRIGYGRTMQLVEELWRERLPRDGLPVGGELTVGPCAAALVPCVCEREDRHLCAWCCGTGRVTKRVREAAEAAGPATLGETS